MVTSVRLEVFYWEALDEIAFRDGLSVTGLIRKLYLESIEEGHNIGSFTSFLVLMVIFRDSSPLAT